MRPNFDEIAKITRDLNYAYIAGYKRLIGRDDILALKGGGDLKLYETVAQDDQVKSCVQQRISAVISRDWGVEPGDDSKPAQQAAEFIEQELKNLQWDRINEKMLWGSFYGYSVGEIMWRRGDKIGIDDIKVRNRRRFNFGTDLQPKLITLEDPLGEDLPDQKFWHFCCGGDNDDDPYGRGLAHWLYWPTFFKRSDMRWWVTFLEKYAQPTRLGKYQPGASETDKDTLWQAMDAFGTNGKMMIPEGTMIELLEAARAGGADYQGMLDICNAAISKIVLSQTMTTDNGSSESQANVHQDVKDDIVKADADLVCSSFNEGPVKWLIDWNFPPISIKKPIEILSSRV
jgi:phage gp29-like protein